MKKINTPVGTTYYIPPMFQAALEQAQTEYLDEKIPRLEFIRVALMIALEICDRKQAITSEDNIRLMGILAGQIDIILQFKETGYKPDFERDQSGKRFFGAIPNKAGQQLLDQQGLEEGTN
jgi:hypothetical protein